MNTPRAVRSIAAADAAGWSPAALVAANEPVVLRGLAADWPLVAAGRDGADAAIAYLKRFDGARPVVAFTGDAAMGGRFFYRDDFSGFNFDANRTDLSACLDRIRDGLGDPAAPAIYVGSTDLDLYLPGLRGENDLPWPIGTPAPMVSIWIGNRTTAATHYDMSNNLAACMVGRRRFTLFPPEQVANLYPGPMEPTPGGQVMSMVDVRAPDLDRFPRFAEALLHAQVAELEPGDVLFYPALWWHNVEALSPFNAMINYWWNDAPAFADSPMTTLLHALLSLRERPAAERSAWAALFDHYVWSGGEDARAHLPPAIQGDLAPLDEPAARRLRARLLQRLNR